jgi:hypothetical protein
MVLLGYLCGGQVQVVIDHLEGDLSKDNAQQADITSV